MIDSFTVVSSSPEATETLGARLAGLLPPGCVLALHGTLGTGKTVLSRGLARGLGIDEPVTSPTFTVVQEYERPDGSWFFHLDMYRIDDDLAALAFGIEEYLFVSDGVTVVEWPERIAGLLLEPPEAAVSQVLTVNLTYDNAHRRHITLEEKPFGAVRAWIAAQEGLELAAKPEDASP